ncbi:MAG: N-acetylmuramoyl-L-alanine amidase [Candidatus Endobugula sp.]
MLIKKSVTSASASLRWSFFCLLLIANVTYSAAINAATIDSVRLWRAPDHTRVVLDMSATVKYKLFSLQNPDRLVVDIDGANTKANFARLDVNNTPLKRVRTAARNQHDLRLVFDLRTAIKPRSFLLKPNKGKPHRLVIDLYDKGVVTKKTVSNIGFNNKRKPSLSPQPTAQQKPTPRDIIVVVDPGHGGEDPGAIGPRRVKEKVVVLDIAKKLAKLINNKSGYKAILTRDGDYFIPLRKRRDKARLLRADLFVSIHADAFKQAQANGASVYALSRRGATSETARFLAKQENEADLIGGVGDVSLDDKDEVLRGVLVDLSITATVGASLELGKTVLGDMGKLAHLHKKQVEQAGFLVLKSPDVPSILIETGFISNPKEEKLLSSPAYRQKMATAIFNGIDRYFYRKPPAGSYVAWEKNGGKEAEKEIRLANKSPTTSGSPGVISNTTITHKVANGESLSVIGQRYRVSVAKIKKLNKLKSNAINIGQVLTITEKRKVEVEPLVFHKVKSGETLSEIAMRYKTSSAVLRQRNKLSSSAIQIGQTLRISN